MNVRYFRKKNPECKIDNIEWIEMTGREFYRFVNSSEGQGRHFIHMGDVVLEATEAEARSFKTEQNHHYYIQAQESGWDTLSLYAAEDKSGYSGEEVVKDDTQDVEAEVMPLLSPISRPAKKMWKKTIRLPGRPKKTIIFRME